MLKKLIFLHMILVLLLTPAVFSEPAPAGSVDWQRFRGPNGSGVYETTGLPLEFGPDKNIIWKTPLPPGHSSPVLTQELIFLTAIEGETLYTICLNRRDGSMIWKKEAPRPRQTKIDGRNSPASPSPVTDGKQVYVFFADFGILAYDLKGKELWRFPLGPFENVYGMGASPILADDRVILVCDQNMDSYIIALDKHTGKLLWKTSRPEVKSGHSTPVIYAPKDGEKQVIVPGSFLLISYSVKTGKKIWWVSGLAFEMKSTPVLFNETAYINGYTSPLNQPDQQVEIPPFKTALAQYDSNKDNLLSQQELPKDAPYDWFSFVDFAGDGFLDAEDWDFFIAGLASLNGMLAIKMGGQGDMSDRSIVWQYRHSIPQLPSPLLYKDVLYMLNDGGRLTTFRPATGEVLKQGRLRGAGSHFYASPVAADNKIFIISLRGKVSVLKPGGELDILALNDLQEKCYATPAIAEGRIYIRTEKTLYCFGKTD